MIKYRNLYNAVLLDVFITLAVAGIAIFTAACTIRGLRYTTRIGKTIGRALTCTPTDQGGGDSHYKLDDVSKSKTFLQLKSDIVDWYAAQYVFRLVQRFTISCQNGKVFSCEYEDMGFELLCTIGQHNVVGIAGRHDNTLWIALRGAHTPYEFQKMTQLSQQFVKVTSNFCDRANLETLFHSGLVDLYSHIKSDIEGILSSDVMKTCTSIVVGGFSMGSGLATLAALHIEHVCPGICSVFLAGSPRMANRAMARQIQLIMRGRIVRIVNEDDLICTLPLVNWPDLTSPNGILEYTHVGNVGLLFHSYKGSLTLSHGIQNYVDAVCAVLA